MPRKVVNATRPMSASSNETQITFKALANNEDFFEEYKEGKIKESKEQKIKRLI